MPRPGAVTRSMTRTGVHVVAPQSTQSETIAPREEVENNAREDSPIIYDSITCRGLSAEPVLFDDIAMFDDKSVCDHDSIAGDNSMFEDSSMSDNNSMSDDISMMSDDTLPSDQSMTSPGPKFLAPVDLFTKNSLVILELEQCGALSRGVVTVRPSGELQADLFREPDAGTSAGFFPNMPPFPNTDEQIPSWMRDSLIEQLNIANRGPPEAFRLFYDRLQDAQERPCTNHGVRTAAYALGKAICNVYETIETVQSFVDMNYVSDTYDEEVGSVITAVKRHIVGFKVEDMSREVRVLLSYAAMGSGVKEMINQPLKDLIIEPCTKLLQKVKWASKALHIELDYVYDEEEKARKRVDSTPDSGVFGCRS